MNKQENPGAEGKPALKGKDSWVGQQCVVRKGGWKGFEGVIKDADDKTVRIELSAKAKVITLTRDLICLKNGMYAQNDNDQSTKFDQGISFFYNIFIWDFSWEDSCTSWHEEHHIQSSFTLPRTESRLHGFSCLAVWELNVMEL